MLRTWCELEGKVDKRRGFWKMALCVEDKTCFVRSMLRKQLGEDDEVEGFQF